MEVIEIVEVEVTEGEDAGKKKLRLSVNGVIDNASHIWTIKKQNRLIHDLTHVYIHDWGVYKSFRKNTYEYVAGFFTEIDTPAFGLTPDQNQWTLNCDETFEVKIFTRKQWDSDSEGPRLIFGVRVDTELWRHPWTVREFVAEFKKQVEVPCELKIKFWQADREDDSEEFEPILGNGFGFALETEPNRTIQDDINRAGDKYFELIKETHASLIRSIGVDSLITPFEFPDNTAAASKQYLIYFSQFLADLGIGADTELIQDASRTLFKVTPRDKTESLQRIKEALDIYIAAAASDDFSRATSQNPDIAVLQLQANIDHFRAQIRLVNAVVAAQGAQISAQASEIEMLKDLNFHYKGQLMLHPTKADETGEDVIKGVVSVNSYEVGGVKFHWADILRTLKRRFSKK